MHEVISVEGLRVGSGENPIGELPYLGLGGRVTGTRNRVSYENGGAIRRHKRLKVSDLTKQAVLK